MQSYSQPTAKNGTFISIWLIDATQLNHEAEEGMEKKRFANDIHRHGRIC